MSSFGFSSNEYQLNVGDSIIFLHGADQYAALYQGVIERESLKTWHIEYTHPTLNRKCKSSIAKDRGFRIFKL